MLNREQFLKHTQDPMPIEEVLIPELGGSVWVRTMASRERDAWEDRNRKMDNPVINLRARIAVTLAINKDGSPFFKPEDAETLGGMSAGIISRIADVGLRLSGFTEQDVKALEEELQENPTDSSATD